MKRIHACAMRGAICLILTMTAPALFGETLTPERQLDFSHDWELNHESDGLTDIHTQTAQRLSSMDVALALTIMGGIAGCMILASRRDRTSQAGENSDRNL